MCSEIVIEDDRDLEDPETFIVMIPSGQRVTPPDNDTTVTILDHGRKYAMFMCE